VGNNDEPLPGCWPIRRDEAAEVEPVRDDDNLSGGQPLVSEPRGCGFGVRDDLVRAGVRSPLQGELAWRLVRDDLAPAADAYRDAGERRSRQREDVRVQLRGVHDGDLVCATPCGERAHAGERVGVAEAADRELANRSGAVGNAIEPRATLVQ